MPARQPVTGSTRKAAASTPRKRATKAKSVIELVTDNPLDKAIETMNDEYLQCRDFGHSWRPYHARWIDKYNCYQSELRCTRCTTIRIRRLSANGALIDSNYDYAEGYLTKGLGRLTGNDRDHIRLASILRVLVPGSADDDE